MDSDENTVGDVHYPGDDRDLSTAILEIIDAEMGEYVTDGEFRLYDDIDPQALNNLFQEDARGDTTVQFNTDGVTVTLWGDGAVAYRIAPRDAD